MITYTTTPADHQPIPTAWHTEPRYLGYRDEDYAKPYAKFFRQHTLPPPGHIVEALTLGMSPTEWAYPIEDAGPRPAAPDRSWNGCHDPPRALVPPPTPNRMRRKDETGSFTRSPRTS